MSVLVGRTGSPFFTCGQKAFPDMMGLWEYVQETYPGSAYVGEIRGPTIGNMIVPDSDGLNRDIDPDYIEERWAPMLEAALNVCPTHAIVLEGATPTWSWPDNPRCARIFDRNLKFCAPILWLIHKLKIPRVSIITDPKCYTRDGEMMEMWPECLPQSVLSQEDAIYEKTIQSKKVRIDAVYAKCEYWLLHNRKIPDAQVVSDKNPDRYRGNQMAQFKESRLRKGREDTWRRICDVFIGADFKMCGGGWDGWDPEIFVGFLDTFDDVLHFLEEGVAGPMIPQHYGFTSTKPRMHALMGNCPLFYDGYDSEARILPIDWPTRDCFSLSELSDGLLTDTVEMVLEATKIDFTMLDRVILGGEKIGGYTIL